MRVIAWLMGVALPNVFMSPLAPFLIGGAVLTGLVFARALSRRLT